MVGDGMAGKGQRTKWRLGMIKAQKPAWEGCAGSLMAEMKQNQHCDIWTAKTSSNIGYCQPRHFSVPKTTI